MLRPLCLVLLSCAAPVLSGLDAERHLNLSGDVQGETRAPDPPGPERAVANQPGPNGSAGEPLYSVEIYRQDAETVLWEFAKRAGRTLTLLERSPTLISVYFERLTFEKGLREILRAADLDYVKEDDRYTVGLPIDLRLRFPQADDKIIEATYRCRRINAKSLVETLETIFHEDDFRIATGPEFLTPEVESVGGVKEESASRILSPVDQKFSTHDVVMQGPPDLVMRALSLARKFDRPRKQVRVNIRVVQMTTSAAKNLGVAWMQSLDISANEVGRSVLDSDGNALTNSKVPQGTGLSLGKFTHSVVNINATLNAMEQAGNSRTVANPTLLVLDGEKSFILSGTEYVLPRLESRDSNGQAVYTTENTKLGLYLQVGVQVGLDDDMVLNIYPQVSKLDSFKTINSIDYPVINTIEEQATVRAVKGDVIVLGGIRKDLTTGTKNAVPFLSKVPFLGRLFKNNASTHDTEELVFFLTPEIIDDPEPALDMKFSEHPPAPPAAS